MARQAVQSASVNTALKMDLIRHALIGFQARRSLIKSADLEFRRVQSRRSGPSDKGTDAVGNISYLFCSFVAVARWIWQLRSGPGLEQQQSDLFLIMLGFSSD